MTDEWTIHEDAVQRARMCQMLSARIAELEEENGRYREVLEEILACGEFMDAEGMANEAISIARATLKGISHD